MATTHLSAVPIDESKLKATPAVQRTGILRDWLEQRIKRGKTKVFSERVTVTPQLAQMLLEQNADNRKIRPNKLNQLKADMNANRFKLNGEAIIVAKTGELNDGQHRLRAIVETNKPQDMLLTFGVERESRLTVDTGAARSAGDHLAVAGWPYASTISTVARTAIGYEKSKGERVGRLSDISTAEVFDKANGDKLLQECASYVACNNTKFRSIAKPGFLGFCFYEFAKRRPAEAKTFMEKLRTGTDLSETSPIRILREYLISRPNLNQPDRVELLIKAWNAWLNDTPIKQFRIQGKLPAIQG